MRKAYFLRVLGTALSLQAVTPRDAKEQVLARLAVMRLVQSAKLTEQFSVRCHAPIILQNADKSRAYGSSRQQPAAFA